MTDCARSAAECAELRTSTPAMPVRYDRSASDPSSARSAEPPGRPRAYRVGDWVEIRSKQEILATLDADGRLEGMLFMPEMFQYCGQRLPVFKVAHKTCDYTTSYPFRTRRLERTVHLDTRCDGGAHGGCEAGCLLYWKDAWIKRVEGPRDVSAPPSSVSQFVGVATGSDEARVWRQCSRAEAGAETRFVCQATEVQQATSPLAWWDVRQYVEDYRSGNVGLARIVGALLYSMYFNVSQAGLGLGRPMRWLYGRLHWIWNGPSWPRTPGTLPAGAPTPKAVLNLQPGELVRIKSHEEILKTVTSDSLNRGMHWDAELVPYCGGTYKVLKRVSRIIDEKSGRMVEMKTPSVILDSVVCQARYSDCRMLCPKSMYPYWREIWLERPAAFDGSRAS